MRNLILALTAGVTLLSGAPAMAQSHDHGGHNAASAVQTTPADGAMGAAPTSPSLAEGHDTVIASLSRFCERSRVGDQPGIGQPASIRGWLHALRRRRAVRRRYVGRCVKAWHRHLL